MSSSVNEFEAWSHTKRWDNINRKLDGILGKELIDGGASAPREVRTYSLILVTAMKTNLREVLKKINVILKIIYTCFVKPYYLIIKRIYICHKPCFVVCTAPKCRSNRFKNFVELILFLRLSRSAS